MRTKPLQCILSFLALLGTVHGRVAPIPECTAQVWVRAPDLAPNTIVQGDARVKISAECPAVESVTLGLRFKERSFVKALRSREDAKLRPATLDFFNVSPFVDETLREAREEILTNKDLWIIREEEREVFETTQPFNIGIGNHGVLRDAVQDFAILVPSTNFPPALQMPMFGVPREREIVDVEWIYEYFTQISFSNGTMKDISAGFTAFQPVHDSTNAIQGLSSATVGLKASRGITMGGKLTENILVADYSIEISADSGLTFIAGTSSHVVNAVVTRTGFARTFSALLNVFGCVTPELSPKWAVEYDMSDGHVNSGFTPAPTSVFRTTLGGDKQAAPKNWRPHPSCSHHPIMMPNSTSDEIQAKEIVTTTSARFTIHIKLDDAHVTNFETYYQTLANSLTINLQIPRAEDEEVDPDDPSGERDFDFGWGQMFEDDEEAWVPWEKKSIFGMPGMSFSYSGRVPVVVHPPGEVILPRPCLTSSTTMSGQVVLSDEMGCERLSPLTHYLDQGARGPTFVDRSAIHALLAEDPAERELHAPILKPVMSSPPKGEELVYRYYSIDTRKRPIYVGETWAKKVANKVHLVSVEVSSGPVLHYVELDSI